MTATTVAAAPPEPRKSLEPFIKDDVEYHDHQIRGVRKLARMKSFLLADDMGLGKSLQALTVFAIDVKRGLAETCIVVCPVTLRDNWAEEIEKFTRMPYLLLGEEPHPSRTGEMRKVSPSKRQEQLDEWLNRTGPRILITNYEQLASDVHSETFKRVLFDVAIFDEAHYMKNPDAGRTKACLALMSKRTFLLTGTPMLNKVSELWTLLHKIDPNKYPKYWTFVNRYCVFGGWEGRQVVGIKNEKELTAALGNVMLRRLKNNVLNRDKPNVMRVIVGLTKEQQELYDRVVDELVLESPDGNLPMDIDNAMVKFLRLKQICGTPYSIDPSFPDSSIKLNRAVEIVSQLYDAGEKVVVFTQFRGVLEAFVKRLEKAKLDPVFQIHGDVPTNQRVGVVREWSKVSSPSTIACMLQVAGVGLNMVAASTCVFLDKLFVPGLNQQAIDRLDRIGQTKPVQVIEILARGTIEYRVEQILKEKSKLFGEVVEGGVSMRRLLEALKEQLRNDLQ